MCAAALSSPARGIRRGSPALAAAFLSPTPGSRSLFPIDDAGEERRQEEEGGDDAGEER